MRRPLHFRKDPIDGKFPTFLGVLQDIVWLPRGQERERKWGKRGREDKRNKRIEFLYTKLKPGKHISVELFQTTHS